MQKVKRYFLEIKQRSFKKFKINSSRNYSIYLEDNNKFELNKFFYKQIGVDHYWRDRLIWSKNDWLKYVSSSGLETWILKKENDPVGFYEQQYHSTTKDVELINMGILKEHRGNNLGSILLMHAINKAFSKKTKKMWVHTCSLDHKYALKNYISKGFNVYKEEEIDFFD
jgi:ribosomal protein S18 acetylase RimI-like enzyme